MSYSYYLFINTPESPANILKIFADLIGDDALADELNFNNILIRANYEDNYNAELVESAYGIRQKINVSFRHSSIHTENDQDGYMFASIANFLQVFNGDVVLETEDPKTVLIKRNNDLIINQNFSNFDQLQKIFSYGIAKSLPDL